MGFFSKIKAPTFLLILLSLIFFISSSINLQSGEDGFISVVISDKGLDFAKELLIRKAISSIIPLDLSNIEKSVKIPLIGKVRMSLSNIVIDHVDIISSQVETNETGISLVASGATANLSMNWKYSYKSWLIEISDSGGASVQVEGMAISITVALKEQDGALKLSLLECRCDVEDISIDLDGGASWLYQGLVDAFQGKIGSAIENAISKKIGEGITKLGSLLQSIPKEIRINDIASLNVTFVENPVLHNSSIKLKINGLFTDVDSAITSGYGHELLQNSVYCKDPEKMIEISLHENVFNSASLLLFNAGHMHWTVDKIPDQSLMNTAAWRDIIPQLYNQYPDDKMNLNISVSSPPFINVMNHDIDATIFLDMIIDVFDAGEVIPVACISLEITASCTPEISGNNLTGHVSLKSYNMVLKWSNIDNLQLNLVQSVTSVVIDTVFLPYINSHLGRGFPLPLLRGFTLQNAEIVCSQSRIVVCSDVVYEDKNSAASMSMLSTTK